MADYNICAAICDCLTLRVATTFITNKDSAVKSMENLSLVSALLLTMVTITESDELGDKLVVFVEQQTVETIYVVLSFCAVSGFFLSTMAAACVLIFSSFIVSDSEFLAYLAHTEYLWKVTLGTFLFAFFSFVASQLWMLMTMLGVKYALLLATPSFLGLFTILFGFAHSAQTIHRIRHEGSLMKADKSAGSLES